MASNGNRNSGKNYENESRTGTPPENRGNKRLPDNDQNPGESISTAGDTSDPKYSDTNVRKEDKERSENSDKSR